MKHKLLPVFSLLLGIWLLLTNSMLNPNNPPTGKTGAPGEATCASADCHTGGTFQGTVSITGIPDTVVANQSYSITLTNTSNAVKAGFQMTVWDGANAMSGTFTAGTGVSIGSGTAGKKYARQSSPKTLTGGAASWTFSWKAPTVASGNKATFYFVSLCANNNGGKTGDNVVQATKTVVLKSTSAANEPSTEAAVKFFPTLVQQNTLNIELLDAEKGEITIFDMNGKLTLQQKLSRINVLNVHDLPKGIFTAQILAG
ncbi:MAG: choice-of-anchor V domain-containing protein, partial [Saprospiraceae bacterium]